MIEKQDRITVNFVSINLFIYSVSSLRISCRMKGFPLNVMDIHQVLDEVPVDGYNCFRLYNGYIYGGKN